MPTTSPLRAPSAYSAHNQATATDAPDPIETLLAEMTLREKIGQLFLVRPDALDFARPIAEVDATRATGVTAFTGTMRQALADYPVGGIALFHKNIVNPDQLKGFIRDWQQASRIPLFVAVDEEGGAVARIANHPSFSVPKYENAAAVGNTGDPAAALAMGQTIGAYLRPYGFNLNFAPDADVNTNPDNPVIGTRAFSSEPTTAAAMTAACVQGFHDAGIACVIKHFPGHGDTAEDSHYGCATTKRTWDDLLQCELLPFQSGIAAGADMVMSAHITTPNITKDGLPATLSRELLTVRLRSELSYDGVIITDSLAMQAISSFYSPTDAACMAFAAGADLLLMPGDLRAAFDGVCAAVESGAISHARLHESLRRIFRVKQALRLI